MKKLGVGIIGMGVGEAHYRAAAAHASVGRVRVADLSAERCAELRAAYPGVDATQDPRDVLDDPAIDVVCVASYDDAHAAQILAALERGKHVFAEKPACLYAAEAADVRRALTARQDLRFGSNLILRAYPRFRAVYDLVRSGALGEVFAVEGDYLFGRVDKVTAGWRGKLPFYSAILGGGIHLVDLLVWLMDREVVEVHAVGNRIATAATAFRFDSFVSAHLRFAGGAVGKVTANLGCMHPHFHGFRLFATEGSVEHRAEGLAIQRSRDPAAAPAIRSLPYPGVAKGAIFADFLDRIADGRPAAEPIDRIFHVLDVCFAAEESLRTGLPVNVARATGAPPA